MRRLILPAATMLCVLGAASHAVARTSTVKCGGKDRLHAHGLTCHAAKHNLAKAHPGFTCARVGHSTTRKCTKKHHHGVYYTYVVTAKKTPAPSVLSCGSPPSHVGSPTGIIGVTASKTTCATAQKVAQAAPADRTTKSYSAAGFACTAKDTKFAGLPALAWRCTKGTALVTFNETFNMQ